MSAILGPLLPDPPGTWVRPDQWPPEGWDDFDPTRSTHDPVTVVTLTTPNLELTDDDHTVQWESWRVTPVGGPGVTWDDRVFPRGTATVEVPPYDAVAWAPGPGTNQPETPTMTPDAGVPWALTPWGTLVAVHVGWDTPDGRVGVRLFDGVVTATDLARPGDTWQLTCADFTSLLDDTQAHQDRALWQLTESVSQPQRDSTDGYRLRTAVKFMAREATENWWPLPLAQLPHDDEDLDAGAFGFDWDLEAFDDEATLIDADTNMGGQSLWAWIEEWCDTYRVEAAVIPGAAGTIRVADSPATGTASRLTFAEGENLLAWTAGYARIINRALATVETRGPRTRRTTVDPGAWAQWVDDEWSWTWEAPTTDPTGWDSSHHEVRIRWQGLEVTLEADTLDGAAVQLLPHSVDWGDGQVTGRPGVQASTIDQGDYVADDTFDPGTRRLIPHRYDLPGRYVITATFAAAAGHVVQVVMIRDFTDLPERTFAMQGQSVFNSGASSVRRSGRKTWTGVKHVGRWFADAETEDREDLAKAWANRMRNRVRGRERTAQLHVVPAPWITPGDTIRIRTARLGTQRMTVTAVTVPITPTPDGMTIDAGYRDLAPGDDSGGGGGNGGAS